MHQSWDEETDFIVIGSGAGASCAGLQLRSTGHKVLVLEKETALGGSSAMSGGVLWIPNSPPMQRKGIEDSYDDGWRYMAAIAGDAGAASSPMRREAFLRSGPDLITFMERNGVKFRHCEGWSDYYDELPGGKARGRSLCCPLVTIKELGPWAKALRRHPRAPPMASDEIRTLMLMTRTLPGALMAVRVAVRIMLKRLLGRDLVGMGAAMQGRFIHAAVKAGVEFRTGAPVRGLIEEGGCVVGVQSTHEGRERRIRARVGVLINAGGFAHNQRMRDAYGPPGIREEWSASNLGDTGEMIEEAIRLGASVDLMDEAWWIPSVIPPGGTPAHMVGDISKPHLIVVDSHGDRVFDESASYMENGQRMIERNRTVPAFPCWAIFDHSHRSRYVFAGAKPHQTPAHWLESGFLKRADSIEALARLCAIDPTGLRRTVERFNGFAKTGKDLDFRRGERAYDRCHGDPTNRPNPNLGAIERAPFYAVKIYPGDAGTSGGVLTDEHGRVLKGDGTIVPGLYATGNSTASVFGRKYGGAGASIAASCVFAWLAAKHASGMNS